MPSGIMRAELVKAPVGASNIKWVPEAAGQSFVAFQLVKLSSGKAAAVAGNTGAEKILGIALAAASGSETSTNSVPVMKLPPGLEFRMSAYHVTPASAITAIANVGAKSQVVVSGGKTCIDVANIASGTDNKNPVVITGIDSRWAAGTQYGVYVCSVRDGYYDLESV